MPRPEDIAWNFVVRLDGKRWRCPYCHKVSSGSVTRVKGHFRKQPKEGIAFCTKVPEHIRTLMELLLNHELHNKDDIAWKFVNRVEDSKWRCHHCREEFFGDLTGVKGHLLKVPNEGISICTQVPDHVRTLMRLLLDEVAEEESRGANGQFSTEPQSHDMPAQAEVGEEESREVNRQFSMEPELCDTLPPAVPSPPQVLECTEHLFTTREETDLANLTSDQQQGECQSHQSLTMPSLVQNSHVMFMRKKHLLYSSEQNTLCFLTEVVTLAATIETCVSQQPSSHWQTRRDAAAFQPQRHLVPAPCEVFLHDPDIFQQSNQSQQSCDAESDEIALLNQQLSMGWFASPSLDSNHPPQLFDQSVQGNGQQHLSASSSLPNEVAEEQSREAHGQSSTEPQSRDMPTQPLPCLTPESLEYMRTLLPTPRGVTHMANFTPQGVIGLNSDQQSQAEHQLRQSSAMPLLAQSSPALVPAQYQSVLHQSINHETRDMQQNATMPLDNLCTTQQLNLHDYLSENLVESVDVIVNLPEETQTNELHNPTVGSSLQNDLSLDVDRTNHLQDCSQLCVVEGVPGLSNTSPTNTVQHPNQLHQRCDKEYGNDTHSYDSQTPVDTDRSIALQHTSDSHIIEETVVDLQVPEAATNTTGPSSSQDVNRVSPIVDVWNNYATDKEMKNLKRKVGQLDVKEADTKEQMEIESAASSVQKKPRKLVKTWLRDMARARNNFQTIGQANAKTLPPKEQVETLTREVEELINQTLPQPLLIKDRDAKGVKFLERKLVGKVIHRNIKWILDRLKENHACRLGIYGMGGVGKTTIMKRVHNRLLEDATFDGVVFVTVSKDFSISMLQIDIAKALKFDVKEVEDEEKRAAKLAEHLERKKNCVLILDDVWECQLLDLKEVGIPDRAHGFKLVLTTRSFDLCCQMRCQEKIKIEPLSQAVAERLFLVELGSKGPPNLEIAKSIVKECAGLPIGVITMARSMLGVTDAFEWRDALERLKESSMGLKHMENKVLMILKFSYDRLGDPDVQQCFLSCAFYLEDGLIYKFKMVEFFIDQGLIDGLNTRKKQYDRGLTILNKLIRVCLLEDDGDCMKMHDLIRDMALHIMSATSMVKTRKGLMRIPLEEYWTDALEKVSLMGNNIGEFPLNMSPNCPNLSTLLLDRCLWRNLAIPDSFFKNLLGLKVLNLSGNNMTELPNSISDLVNLRALLLRSCCKLHCIPYLGKLTSLRKLDAHNCRSLEGLEGLKKLVNLRYLDLTYTGIERLPKGTLEHLLNLQYLKVSAINEDNITKLGALETFECYPKNADTFNHCVRFIEQSNNPRYYNLKVSRYYGLNVGLKIPDFIAKVSDDAQFGNPGRSVDIKAWGHAIVSVGGACTGIFILIPRDVQTMTMKKCNGLTNLSGIGLLKNLRS